MKRVRSLTPIIATNGSMPISKGGERAGAFTYLLMPEIETIFSRPVGVRKKPVEFLLLLGLLRRANSWRIQLQD